MNISELSSEYEVRKLTEDDVDIVYQLSLGNPMYFEYCPPAVTKESIIQDMSALPPRTTKKEKYYVGYFEQNHLVAVADLIVKYPNEQTAFVGFFMMAIEYQKKGIGSKLVKELEEFFRKNGYRYIRLGFVKGNPQSEAFWKKNGFIPTGIEAVQECYTVVVMQKELK